MAELQSSVSSQSPLYRTNSKKVTIKAPEITYHPRRKPPPNMARYYLNQLVKHLKAEYWAYIALGGLSCLYTGVMLAVFGFTDILDPSHGQVEWLGLVLILAGASLILTSGILYHRKNRRLRPCICCGVDLDDTPELEARNKKRLRFAPNLISPYYDMSKEQQQQERHQQFHLRQHSQTAIFVTASPVEELPDEPMKTETVTPDPGENGGRTTTTPVEELAHGVLDEDEQRADNSEGSSTALITRENNGMKVTPC